MNITKNKNIKVVLVFLLFLALVGGIFFMPMQLNGKYTCFYHRIFDENQPVLNNSSESNIPDPGKNEKRTNRGMHGVHSHGDSMIEMYIGRYAFFWWGSIALLALVIYALNIKRHQSKNE